MKNKEQENIKAFVALPALFLSNLFKTGAENKRNEVIKTCNNVFQKKYHKA